MGLPRTVYSSSMLYASRNLLRFSKPAKKLATALIDAKVFDVSVETTESFTGVISGIMAFGAGVKRKEFMLQGAIIGGVLVYIYLKTPKKKT